MIKILHVISDKNIGGAGRLLLNLLAESDRKKFEISVILQKGSLLTPKITELGFEAVEIDLSLSSLFKTIKRKKPDIVHTHAAAAARVAARLCGVSAIFNTKHCSEEVICKTPLRKRAPIRAFDMLFTDRTIATAEYVKDRLTADGVPSHKISVIINGSLPLKELSSPEKSQIRASLGYTDNDFIVGIIARLETGKGQEYFIKAAEICQHKSPKIKFLVVGDGSMADKLKIMAKSLDNLKFLGFVSDVTEIMNILDANINCSYISETSSLSLSEGMSVGAVPVVSDCGGNSFMAKDCGIVFPKKDSVKLSDALILLEENRELLKCLKKSAKERFFKEFTAKKMAKQTEALYLRYLNKYETNNETNNF